MTHSFSICRLALLYVAWSPAAARARWRGLRAGGRREELAKFDRGPRVDLKSIKDKKVKASFHHRPAFLHPRGGSAARPRGPGLPRSQGQMKYRERLYKEARHQAAKVGQWLLPAEAGVLEAEGMERTYRFKQDAIVEAVEEGAARKVVDLKARMLVTVSSAANQTRDALGAAAALGVQGCLGERWTVSLCGRDRSCRTWARTTSTSRGPVDSRRSRAARGTWPCSTGSARGCTARCRSGKRAAT